MTKNNLIFEADDNKYIFFGDHLTIYKIEDKEIEDHLNGINNIEEIDEFFRNANNETGKINIAKGANDPLNAIILVTSNDCNLRCKYCYAVDFKMDKHNYMDFNIAKNSVDYLLKQSPDLESYGIVFFGGEPLINFKLIQKVVNYSITEIVNKRGKGVGFSMTTNGTILTDKIISFLKQYNFSITISIDGAKEDHDKNRVYKNGDGSYEQIIKNIDKLKKADINFELRATISSDANLFDTIKFLENKKISFGFGLTMNTKNRDKNITEFEQDSITKLRKEYTAIVDYYYEKINNNEKIYCQNIMSSLTSIETRQGKVVNCTASRNTISIDANGEVLPCQNFQNYPEIHKQSILSVNSTIKPVFIAPNVEDLIDCNTCFAKYFCAGGCFFEKYNNNSDINIPPSSKCVVTKIQWEYMFKLYVKLQNSDLLKESIFIKQENFYV